MKAITPSAQCFEFCFPDRDTLVQVKTLEDEIHVRATRDTFSESRKIRFIHQLAAEGFIADRYQWFSSFETPGWNVRWQVDSSWLELSKAAAARTRQFMIRLLASSALLWLGIMAALFRC